MTEATGRLLTALNRILKANEGNDLGFVVRVVMGLVTNGERALSAIESHADLFEATAARIVNHDQRIAEIEKRLARASN